MISRGRLSDLVSATPRALGMVRTFVFGFLAIQALITDFSPLAYLPTTLMHPPGIMEFLSWKFYDRFMTPKSILLFKVVLVVSLAVAAAGYKTSTSTKFAAIAYVFYQGLLRSFGHVNHDEMVAIWSTIVLAMTSCGDGFSIDARLNPAGGDKKPPSAYGYPIFLMRCILAWSYFSAALLKLRIAGLEYFTADSLLTLMVHNSLGNMHDSQFQYALLMPQFRSIMGAAALSAVVWELLFPLALISRTAGRVLLWIGVVFHVSTLLLMNITFPVQIVMYGLFVDWEGVAKRFIDRDALNKTDDAIV